MFDVTFLIPDYREQDEEVTPPDPDDEMPVDEKERLFEELCALIDSGTFDPDNEILV